MVKRRAMPLALLAVTLLAAFATTHCSGTPAQPSTTLAMSGIVLNPSVISAGNTVQGTITLTSPAPAGGTSISLSSSNTTVATVQTPVTIQSGASSATFVVTARAAGTANITASLNGTTQSPVLTVTAVALASISLSASSVVGGNPVTGTATLTGVAPAGGVVVTLTGGDPVTVPATVAVPAGSATGTFTVSTRAVAGTIASMITGAYGGGSASAVLSVNPITVATANFGVTGTEITETCKFINNGANLDCSFDGSTSTAPGTIVAWNWTYTVATTMMQTTAGPRLMTPVAGCALVPPPPLPAGQLSFTMIVTLSVRDSLGNVSAVAVDGSARLLPQGACGF